MKCTGWRPVERNTLQGFATLVLDNGIVLLDCALHQREGKRWCSPPSRPMLDRDRKLVIGDDGKVRYTPTIEFVDASTRFKWSAVAAIDRYLAESKEPAAMTTAGSMNGGVASEVGNQGTQRE